MFYRFAARIRGAGAVGRLSSPIAASTSALLILKGYRRNVLKIGHAVCDNHATIRRCVSALACSCSARRFSAPHQRHQPVERARQQEHRDADFLEAVMRKFLRASAAPTGQRTVIPNETNAPEMVLQATGQYSICHSGYFYARFTHYVLVSTSRALSKSVGYKAVGRLLGLKKGSGCV